MCILQTSCLPQSPPQSLGDRLNWWPKIREEAPASNRSLLEWISGDPSSAVGQSKSEARHRWALSSICEEANAARRAETLESNNRAAEIWEASKTFPASSHVGLERTGSNSSQPEQSCSSFKLEISKELVLCFWHLLKSVFRYFIFQNNISGHRLLVFFCELTDASVQGVISLSHPVHTGTHTHLHIEINAA